MSANASRALVPPGTSGGVRSDSALSLRVASPTIAPMVQVHARAALVLASLGVAGCAWPWPRIVDRDVVVERDVPVDPPEGDSDVGPCGNVGQPCCQSSLCVPGNECTAGTCRACGGRDEACCASSACSAGLMCADAGCTCLATQARCAQGQVCCAPNVCSELMSDHLLHCCRDVGVACRNSDDCCGPLVCCTIGGAAVCHAPPCP